MRVAWRWPALMLLWLSVVPAAVGCGATGGPDLVEARSDKERVTTPDVAAEQLAQLSRDNRAFAVDLYRALREGDGNLFFSPYSVSSALAMTYAGARGDTETEIAEAFNYTLPQAQLHPAFNALDLELARRGKAELYEEGERFHLNIANSVWGEREHEFLDAFLDTLAEQYGAGLRLVDFRNDPDGARETINEWVSDETEERIPELIPPGMIDNLTRLVLTNAIYFSASWAIPFEEYFTREDTFHLLDGTDVRVTLMHLDEELHYAQIDGVQAIELLYVGGDVSMVVVVPDEGAFKDFESRLDATLLDSILGQLQRASVNLKMPNFEFESSFALEDTLGELGMPSAFDERKADFSGMDGTRELFLSQVVHKAFVSVDEQGTEAAAATAVGVPGVTAPSVEPVELVIDRPFLFLIRDLPTGTVLFFGRVLDPTS